MPHHPADTFVNKPTTCWSDNTVFRLISHERFDRGQTPRRSWIAMARAMAEMGAGRDGRAY